MRFFPVHHVTEERSGIAIFRVYSLYNNVRVSWVWRMYTICVCLEWKRGTRQNGSIYKYKGVGSPLISDDEGTVDDPKRPADFLLSPPLQPQPPVY